MQTSKNTTIAFEDWGIVPYNEGVEKQLAYFQQIVDIKVANRDLDPTIQVPTPNFIFSCQHTHVYTLGRSGKESHLLLDQTQLKEQNIDYTETTRGGDITYHGPGQLVVYPILDLENFFTDIHKYMRLLEETVIQTLAHFDIVGERIKGMTGVWITKDRFIPTKICAMGVKTSRWVTMHGIGLNVNTDLNYFNNIVPCGIEGKGITSIAEEKGYKVDILEVADVFLTKFTEIFECKLINLPTTVNPATE